MRYKILLIGVLGISLVYAFSTIRNMYMVLNSGTRLNNEQTQVKSLRQENARLKLNIAEAEQEDFIEKVARDQLNMAYPNETVIVLPKPVAAESFADSRQLDGHNWQRWYALFFE